jgi:hypothetical protein
MVTKKKPDYLNLPFEVHFNLLNAVNYEFIHEIGITPKSPDDYIGVVIHHARAKGVSFRADNAGDGSLAYVLANKLDEYLPEWLEYIEEVNYDVKVSETRQFKINGKFLALGDAIDSDDLDDIHHDYGPSKTFYSCEGMKPAYLILDVDGSKVFVDSEGYRLAQDDMRMDKKPLVTFDEEEVDSLDLTNIDETDVEFMLAKLVM